ncbi:MAG: signal peptide peptidase SppA [Bacteroidia bacterium]|nr:signal peptide peptidase SppA [Bacteroidia bacterium]
MRNFFASLFGALIGIFLAFFLIFIICVGIITNAVRSVKEETITSVPRPSVLEIKLNHPISERTPPVAFNFRLPDDEARMVETSGLNDILADIHHAAHDKEIKGIFLNLSDIPAGFASLQNIRGELERFKSSGKFIIAYSMTYSQKSYYLASVANKVYLHPGGNIMWKGLGAQIMFYKRALDKLGIQVEVFRHGRFKSFVEPFVLDKMSPDNRLQTKAFITSIWNDMLDAIGSSRHIDKKQLNIYADSLTIRNAAAAEDRHLADTLYYSDQILDKLRQNLGIKADQAIPAIGLDDYRHTFSPDDYAPAKIALIYASGEIQNGYGDDQNIGALRLSQSIRQARLDKDIKAIVFRVNSPGGDALASEVIWREVSLAAKAKPVVVSMGDYAASGGYEISCAATEIVAEPTTITGSIGVFGLIPDAGGLLSDKLGITVDTVGTNSHATAPSLFYPLTTAEGAIVQAEIEDIYRKFVMRVADGRKMTFAQVDSIGQGRVWTGRQAIKIGLADTLGDISTAMQIAAAKAHLTNYSTEEMPSLYNPLRKLFKRFGVDAETDILQAELGAFYQPVKDLEQLTKEKGIQARLPFNYIIE